MIQTTNGKVDAMKIQWAKVLCGSIGVILVGSTLVMAQSEVSPSAHYDSNQSVGMGRKLGRGVSNVAFGWIDFFKGIEEVGEHNNGIAAITWGPIYGLGKAIRRTAAGVVEVATFPVKTNKYNEPIVEPEFVMGDNY